MSKLKYLLSVFLVFGLKCGYAQLPDSWNRISDFGGIGRAEGVSFTIDSFGYVGLGILNDTIGSGYIYPTDFWQYNPRTNSWVQKASFPSTGRPTAISFVIGSKAYVGLGGDGSGYRDFYEYDPLTDRWTQKNSFIGGYGGYRRSAFAFSIGDKGYVGCGITDTGGALNDFWEYDPTADTWTQKNNFAGLPRLGATSLSIDSFGYVFLGFGDHSTPYYKDCWRYNPNTDSWMQRSSYPGDGNDGAFCFVINNKAYIGTGNDSLYQNHSDFWEYDPSTDAWVKKDSFGPGNRSYGIGFSLYGKGYAGIGTQNSTTCLRDFWVYTPDSISTEISEIEAESLQIYPNPATDKIYISKIPQNAILSIRDVTGHTINTPTLKDELDISLLPSGMYFIVIMSNEGDKNIKFIKL